MKAMVVLSGGQDSTTCLFWAIRNFEEVFAVSFDYGQNHVIELESAATVARMGGVPHEIISVPGVLVSTSPLTNNGLDLERYENADQMEAVIGNRVEKTFVPMRNTLFLTLAMNRAIAAGCEALVTGICQEDNANYPDCTEQFRHKFEAMARQSLGNAAKDFRVLAPLMWMSKAETVKLARILPGCWTALAYSHTSYDGKYPPIDMNHANVLRAKGFADAGEADPLVLRAYNEALMALPLTSNYDMYRK